MSNNYYPPNPPGSLISMPILNSVQDDKHILLGYPSEPSQNIFTSIIILINKQGKSKILDEVTRFETLSIETSPLSVIQTTPIIKGN